MNDRPPEFDAVRGLRGACRALLLALAPLVAAGCAAPVGDFERPRASVVHDEILPKAGLVAAYVRGEPVSQAPFTDDERELRDLAYAILMPPMQRQEWERRLAEMRRTRIFPDYFPSFDPDNYGDVLIDTPYRSSTARYNRLIEDISADSARIGPFFATAGRVAHMDGIRAKGIAKLPNVPPGERASAEARIAENGMLIAWVERRFDERRTGYRIALERLVVATPAPAAVAAERSLQILEQRLAQFAPSIRVAAAELPPPDLPVRKP